MRRVDSDRQRGSATAELAVVLPSMVLVLAVLVWVIAVASMQLRCVEAARAGARAAARGEADAAIARRARGSTGLRDAEVRIRRRAGEVSVEVRAAMRPPLGAAARFLPETILTAQAHAAAEGDADPGAEP